ncbi:unnamed protein product [Clonostachys rosea]|uniref:Uncharacterized protein n=1 Tax=Bionectria ochroleuca TaxID=29856 RepID=A0ABY6U6D6_BIOOC|nr:unnamed protein product [Clonostachys rosea]
MQSLESCLSGRIPQDAETQALLKRATSSLWLLITYFAQWPFAAASPTSRPAGLTFTAWVRAIAFLCGRHSKIFQPWDPEDHLFDRRKQRVGETDLPVLEYLFRGLATDIQAPDPPAADESAALSALYTLQRDVLDILNTIEPTIHIYTPRISRAELVPIADRLCSPLAPLPVTSLGIPLETLTPLLDLSVSIVQHTAEFDKFTWANQRLGEILEATQTGLQKIDGPVTYDVFTKFLSDDIYPNIYDAVALIFTAFPSPKVITQGIMFDPFYRLWYPELIRSERRLFLMALREPGYGESRPLEMEEDEN